MKIIDLLNKIANGEKVPEKFRFAGQIFEKQGSYIEDEDGDSIFESISNDFSNINGEVEIIEEDKKIEKVDTYVLCDYDFGHYEDSDSLIATTIINKAIREYSYKINEIIDYLNKEKENE